MLLQVTIDPTILEKIPNFKVGMIMYHNITVEESPQMVKGRLQLFYEEQKWALADKAITDFEGIREWRSVFKALGMDPSRYRPSHEALFRRLKKEQPMPEVHSAVDLLNFFSVRHEIPMGLYDLAQIEGNEVMLRLGTESDHYDGINGRDMDMQGKLLSADQKGAFGSPIVDSKRTRVSDVTTDAIHLIYHRPSTSAEAAIALLNTLKEQFVQIHGGTASVQLLP